MTVAAQSTNYSNEINVLNPTSPDATPYFTANATGIYSNGILIDSGGTVVNGVTINAGASGTAGTINVFPTTASKGKTAITVADNSGNTTTAITVAAQTGARTYTVADAGGNDTFTMNAATQTLTNKTLTDFINGGSKVCTAQVDVTSSTTLVNVTGLAVALTAGATYNFRARITGTAGASGGAKVAMVASNSLTATSVSYTAWNYNAGTINAVTSTTTLGTAVGGANAVITDIIIEGSIVVAVAGTLNVQIAQNTSNGTATSAYINSNLTVNRVA